MERVDKKLFLWITFLAFLGGAMNSYAIMKYGLTVGHVTGNLTKVSMELAEKQYETFKLMFPLVSSFFMGTIISGIIVGMGQDFELKKRYGDTFIVVGIILKILEMTIFDTGIFIYCIAFCLGLQNGLFIRYRGMVIRTTHMTGTVTDLGVAIGHYIRGEKAIGWKTKYYFINILAFAVGAFLIAKYFYLGERATLNILSLLYLINGIYYFLLRGHYFKLKRER